MENVRIFSDKDCIYIVPSRRIWECHRNGTPSSLSLLSKAALTIASEVVGVQYRKGKKLLCTDMELWQFSALLSRLEAELEAGHDYVVESSKEEVIVFKSERIRTSTLNEIDVSSADGALILDLIASEECWIKSRSGRIMHPEAPWLLIEECIDEWALFKLHKIKS